MANNYDDLYDIENLGDEELRDVVLQQLRDNPRLDVDLIDVAVTNGAVRLSGRVGTEQEQQLAERVLTDMLGIAEVDNELVIDELVRGERSEAADDAWVEDAAGSLSASGRLRTSDEAAHLMEDVETDQFGTSDPQEAIERGTSYDPPTSPVQEGISREQH